jgi:hypothetical protein
MVRQKVYEANYGSKEKIENFGPGQGSPVMKSGSFYMGSVGPDIRDMTHSGSKDGWNGAEVTGVTGSSMRNNFLRDGDVRDGGRGLVVGRVGVRGGSGKVGDFKWTNNTVSGP